MEENTIGIIPGDMSKMPGFKRVCMKLGAMMIIIFVSRGLETVLLSAAVNLGMFDGMDPNMFGGQEVLVLNANHPLVRFIAENQGSEYVPVICEQLYDLAMMSHKQLSPEEMTKFVKRSNDILMVLTK